MAQTGWQIEQEWQEQQKQKEQALQRKLERGGGETSSEEEESEGDDLPFACFICRQVSCTAPPGALGSLATHRNPIWRFC